MAGPHHHHHGGHHHGFGRRDFSTPIVYVEPQLYDYDYCPPGFFLDEFGFCRKRPLIGEASGISTAANLGGLALDKAWPAIDPKGRTFKQALQDSAMVAASKKWTLGVETTFDLIAMIAGSALLSSSVKEDPNKAIGLRASAALDRTWEVLAKRAGWKGEDPIAVQKTNPSSPDIRAALPILEIVIVVVAIAAVAGVYAWAIWKASEIIERQLSISAESDELIRLHSEWQKIVDRHLADPNLPWTPQELQLLADLEKAQGLVANLNAPPKPAEPIKPLDLTVLAVAAAALGGGYYFFLRKRGS
jgi:hypothetical protein